VVPPSFAYYQLAATLLISNMSDLRALQRLKPKGGTKKFSIGRVQQKFGLATVKSVAPKAYGALKISLKVSVEALEKVPIPGLKAAGTGLLALLKAIDVSAYPNQYEPSLIDYLNRTRMQIRNRYGDWERR
jgi:hypothetical protein